MNEKTQTNNNNNNNKTLHREWKSQLPPSLDQIRSWSCWLHWLILIPEEEETRIFRLLKLEVLGTKDFQLALSVFKIMDNSGIELVQGEESFQSTPNEHEKKKEGRKKPCKVGSKISMKSHHFPHALPSIKSYNPKSFSQIFSHRNEA